MFILAICHRKRCSVGLPFYGVFYASRDCAGAGRVVIPVFRTSIFVPRHNLASDTATSEFGPKLCLPSKYFHPINLCRQTTRLNYLLTCVGIHPGRVEPASPTALTTPRMEKLQARRSYASSLDTFTQPFLHRA